MKPTWEVCFDFNNDRDFSDSGEDISAYVIDLEWQLGFSQPYEPISQVSTLSMTLRNTDKRFSPEYAGGAHYPNFTHGRLVRVRSTYSATTRTHFLGWIDSLDPQPNQYGPRTCRVTAKGLFDRAQDAEVFIPVMESTTADLVIDKILRMGQILPPGLSGRWVLGVSGQSNLGQSTTLGQLSDYLVADTGLSTIVIIGDQWDDGVSVYGALRDTAGREAGRVFDGRDGRVYFWNQQHLTLDVTNDATFDNTMSDLTYKYGDLFVNRVTVRVRPRTIGSTATLGMLNGPVAIPDGESKDVAFRYEDTTQGAKISGKNAITPVATTDYLANSAEGGGGSDYTGSVTAVLVEEAATRAVVRFTNAAPSTAYLQPGSKIRGTKITAYGEVDTMAQDEAAISAYGLRPLTYPYEFEKVSEAENLAQFILEERQGPRGRAVDLTLPGYRDDTTLTQCLTRTIGDRIVVLEEQNDIHAAYFIIGEKHSLSGGNADYRVTWLLEPASVTNYWNLGTDTLGETTIIA